MPQERREKEAKEKAAAPAATAAAENSEGPESKKESSESKEENSDSKVDSSSTEAKAEGEKDVTIDLRPLTMEDLRQAKTQVSFRSPDNFCMMHEHNNEMGVKFTGLHCPPVT